MTLDSNDFRRVLGHFPTGVTVVTAITDDRPTGMAIGSFSSVSLDPALVMWCPTIDSSTWASMKPAGSFCVNILGDDQKDVCGVFASSSDDKFAGVDWRTEVTGAPVIDGSLAWIDCELHAIHDGGDHDIVVGMVKALGTAGGADERGPLVFFKGGYGRYEAL